MIYFDNAATSWPKPKAVSAAMERLLSFPLGNPGRTSHPPGLRSAEIIFRARENADRLLGMGQPERIAFFGGATAALNSALCGTVAVLEKEASPVPVFTTVFEHNAVLRPLYALEDAGRITLKILTPGSLLPALKKTPPRLLVMTLCSNVSGHVFPLAEISRLCKKSGTILIADAAQAAGHVPLPDLFDKVDMLCAPGHKGLMGWMGAGFLAVHPASPVVPEAVFSGGSGTEPQSREMPRLLPERLEAGTLPVLSIASLSFGIEFLLERDGVERIARHERALKKRLTEGLSVIRGITLYEPEATDGPVLYNRRGVDPEQEARGLLSAGICTRSGFHCAPLAHAYLGTGEKGAVRLSPGYFSTERQVEEALRCIQRLAVVS